MSTRRQFLKRASLVSLAPLLPGFLSRSAAAVDTAGEGRTLVVIQLDGGNDGLNTIIPHSDENYARYRRELRIKSADVLKINDIIGFHPDMKAAADLLEDGRLAIIQGVGYPNPNRSHFESMAIWHHARLRAEEHDSQGWLGRAAELSQPRNTSAADSIYVGADAVPVALRGRRSNAVALQNESDLQLATAIPSIEFTKTSPLDVCAFVQRTIAQSFDAARQFGESNQNAPLSSDKVYPQTKLAEKLRLVSKLLKLGGQTRIYYVSQTGYDTHAAQLYPHAQLLREFASALKAFLNDLKAAQVDDRVVVLAFSEFGRRVEENASFGTDHGVAGPVFVAGRVRTRLIGEHPSLTDLDQGDLKMAIDFRQVYATLLDQWLKIDSRKILDARFDHLPLLG